MWLLDHCKEALLRKPSCGPVAYGGFLVTDVGDEVVARRQKALWLWLRAARKIVEYCNTHVGTGLTSAGKPGRSSESTYVGT